MDVSVFINDRNFAYLGVDMDNVNVILNSNDVSEYLKISPNGLEVKKNSSISIVIHHKWSV